MTQVSNLVRALIDGNVSCSVVLCHAAQEDVLLPRLKSLALELQRLISEHSGAPSGAAGPSGPVRPSGTAGPPVPPGLPRILSSSTNPYFNRIGALEWCV